MAATQVVIEFIGDPSGLKPASDALTALAQMTKEQQAAFTKALDEGKKRLEQNAAAAKQTAAEMQKLSNALGGIGPTLSGQALKDALKKLEELADLLKNNTDNAQSFGNSMKEIAGALADGTGNMVTGLELAKNSLSLFGAKSEDIEKAISKLNTATEVFKGLQKTVNIVTGDGAAKMGLLKVAQQAYTYITEASSLALKGFRAALVGTGIGALIIGLAELIIHFDELKEAITGVSETERLLEDIRKNAVKSTADEMGKLQGLTIEYTNVNTSVQRRTEILKELNKLSPAHFKNLDVEKQKTEDLTIAMDAYIKSIRQKAEIDALEKQLGEISAKRKNGLQEELTLWQTTSIIAKSIFANGLSLNGGFAKDVAQGTLKELDTIDEELKEKEEKIVARLKALFSETAELTSAATTKVIEKEKDAGEKRIQSARQTEAELTRLPAITTEEFIKHKQKEIDEQNAADLQRILSAEDAAKRMDEINAWLAEQEKARTDELAKKREEAQKEAEKAAIQGAQTIADALFEIQSNYDQAYFDEAMNKLQQQQDAELNNANLTEGQKAAIKEKYRQQEAALKREQFKREKEASIIQATIRGALAVVNALTAVPFSLPAAVLAGVTAAAEIAVIASQPIPQFAGGTEFVHGPGNATSDSIPARLSRGERVVPADINAQLQGIPNDMLPRLAQYAAMMPELPKSALNQLALSQNLQIDYKQMGKAFSEELAKNPQVSLSIDRNGINVLLKKNNRKTNILNNKYRQ